MLDLFLFFLFFPLVVVMMYFIGLIISDKNNFWKEDSRKHYILRFLLGFGIICAISFFIYTCYLLFQPRY